MNIQDIVVLDFDGVIVDLNLPTENVRKHITETFAKEGIELNFRPLLKDLRRALRLLSERDEEKAQQVRNEIWQMIDETEIDAAHNCSIRSGVIEFLDSIRHLPLAIYSNNCPKAIAIALEKAGIPKDYFALILGRDVPDSIKPKAEPLLEIMERLGGGQLRRVFFIGDRPSDMESAHLAADALHNRAISIIPIGLRSKRLSLDDLDKSGAWFMVSDLHEATKLISTRRKPVSLSVVVAAHNNQTTLEQTIADVRRFCRSYVDDYEIIISNDGSSDKTARISRELSQNEDVRSIHHPIRLGLGATIRDGYTAAKKDYVTYVKADRSLRAQSLIHLVDQISDEKEDVVVTSKYIASMPENRKVSERIFQFLVRWLAGMKIHFSGTYLFDRDLFTQVPAHRIGSNTPLYSFELLHQLHKKGVTLRQVRMHSFENRFGQNTGVWQAGLLKTLVEMVNIRLRN